MNSSRAFMVNPVYLRSAWRWSRSRGWSGSSRPLRTTRGQQTVIVIIKRIAVADHHLADGRGGGDVVGQLATESRKQAVGMSDCAADRRRVGAGGDVELGGDQLFGQDYTGVSATRSVQYV